MMACDLKLSLARATLGFAAAGPCLDPRHKSLALVPQQPKSPSLPRPWPGFDEPKPSLPPGL
jgi:hypothetical protein